MPAMTLEYMDRHVSEPRRSAPAPRIVVSSLPRGETVVTTSSTSLKLVLEGEERYEIDGRAHVIRPGQFMILEEGAVGKVVLPRAATGMCLYLHSHRAPARKAGVEPILAGPTVLPAASFELGRKLTGLAVQIAQGLRPAEPAQVVAAAERELARLLADMVERSDRLAAVKPSTRMEVFRRLELVRGHLHDNMGRAVHLSELAALAGMSQFHLARCFAELYGLPPAAYHNRTRLAAAANWLASTNASLAAAAERYGYSDRAAFSRAFKRVHAESPGHFTRRAPRTAKGTAH